MAPVRKVKEGDVCVVVRLHPNDWVAGHDVGDVLQLESVERIPNGKGGLFLTNKWCLFAGTFGNGERKKPGRGQSSVGRLRPATPAEEAVWRLRK